MSAARIPLATYRLQLNRDFGFGDAAAAVPYLHALGISHCHISPILRARAGSSHGYDVVNHDELNAEIGTREEFDRFIATLHAHGMGLVVDIVPNHMGVGGADNLWWLDVLEHGEASAFAAYFDIDWRPAKRELGGRLLLPVLEDHYGAVLEKGMLKLQFEQERGQFGIVYHEHYFPIDLKTCSGILRTASGMMPDGSQGKTELDASALAFDALPGRGDTTTAEARTHAAGALKRALAAVCSEWPSVAEHIRAAVTVLNGDPRRPESFDGLHRLLDRQVYRLAHWLVAGDEINYRRFFDINSLAGLRMERAEVFRATHRFVMELIHAGGIDGLRVDHPDGLFDPGGYFASLRELTGAAGGDGGPAIFTVAEKILAPAEQLRSDWLVHGTTGYEFAAQLNGLLVYPPAQGALTIGYERFIGNPADLDVILRDSRKLVMRTLMSGELMVLANLLDRISEGDRHTRDYTLHALRDALMEVIACFPVYRTYISARGVGEEDRRCIEQSIARAKRLSPAVDVSIFDFLQRVLLLDPVGAGSAPDPRQLHFVMKFQQYTAPVMAKGMEDTAFYAYNRFIALNEVGDDPRRFGCGLAAFHAAARERLLRWPHALLAVSTHDSKRSEDVRARLDVLSEMPAVWGTHVRRWSRLNAPARRELEGQAGPSREDEYLLYQTLVGAWPLDGADGSGVEQFRQRIVQFMIKAVREAKVHSSWINRDAAYEASVTGFIDALFEPARGSAFRADMDRFAGQVALFGMLNSLTQTIIRLTAPGVPDLYQGSEAWILNLVDPDNRRPVDFGRRQQQLEQLKALAAGGSAGLAARVRLLLNTWQDGRPKMYVVWRTLELRQRFPAVFGSGEYLALSALGARADHICAFSRRSEQAVVVVAGGRWYARLAGRRGNLPLGADAWSDTDIEVPGPGIYFNVLTGETASARHRRDSWWLQAASLFARFPVALLVQTAASEAQRQREV